MCVCVEAILWTACCCQKEWQKMLLAVNYELTELKAKKVLKSVLKATKVCNSMLKAEKVRESVPKAKCSKIC